MTTEAPESVETVETAESEAPEKARPTLDDLGNLMLGKLEAQRTEYVSLYNKVEAATSGDSAKLVHDVRENSDDAKVVKFREWYEKVNAEMEKRVAEIDTYIKANLMPKAEMSEDEIKAAEETLKSLAKAFKEGMDYLDHNLYKGDDTTLSFSEAGFIEPLPGTRQRKSGGKSTGGGGKKPRVGGVYVRLNESDEWELASHETDKGERKSNFTDGAKLLATKGIKIAIPDLQNAYFSAANVTAETMDAAPESVDFPIRSDNKTAYVMVTKKSD